MAASPSDPDLLLPVSVDLVRVAGRNRTPDSVLAFVALRTKTRRNASGPVRAGRRVLWRFPASRRHDHAQPIRPGAVNALATHALSSPDLPVHGAYGRLPPGQIRAESQHWPVVCVPPGGERPNVRIAADSVRRQPAPGTESAAMQTLGRSP